MRDLGPILIDKRLLGIAHTWPMTKSYKDNINAYNPPNWGQKYSKEKPLKASFHMEVHKRKSKLLRGFIPNNLQGLGFTLSLPPQMKP